MPQARHAFEALTRAYAEAVLAKAPDRLAAIYDAEVRVFDTWGRSAYEGLAAWRPSLDAWLGSLGEETVEVRFDDVRTSARAEMAMLSAMVTYTAVDAAGRTLRAMQNRLTWVLVRKGDGWGVAHEHTSVPIGDDLKGVLQPA